MTSLSSSAIVCHYVKLVTTTPLNNGATAEMSVRNLGSEGKHHLHLTASRATPEHGRRSPSFGPHKCTGHGRSAHRR